MPTVTFPLAYLRTLDPSPASDLMVTATAYGLETSLGPEGLTVEVTPERPDLLAPEGFLRALRLFQGYPRPLPPRLAPSGLTLGVEPAVLPLRPHIAALVVRQAALQQGGLAGLIQFQEKVTQTFGRQRKKIAIGVYDLDQIQGPITYRAEPGDQVRFIPLGGDKPLSGQEILTQHPAGQAYGAALPPGDLVPILQDGAGQILSMPPIINGVGAGEVQPETVNLLIDVTGIEPQAVADTLNILAHNFLDTGATVETVAIALPHQPLQITPDLARRPIAFSAKYLNEIMGSAIPKAALGQYLGRMDLEPDGKDHILVPTYRTDIFSQVDIAGDLLVALGVDRLSPDPTAVKFYTGRQDALKAFEQTVGDLAQRMGLMEVNSFVLTDPSRLAPFLEGQSPPLTVSNPKSRSLSALRPTLLPGLLEILSRQLQAPKPITLYEIGTVIPWDPATAAVQETSHWAFAQLDDRAAFAAAKAYVQTLLQALGITYSLTDTPPPYYLPGRGAQVWVGDHPVGHFGEIHPRILTAFSFPVPICAGELNLVALQERSP